VKLLWLVPEESGGIRSYSDGIWPGIKKEFESRGGGAHLLGVSFADLRMRHGVRERLRVFRAQGPDHIHIQHEYGLFGSKTPGQYTFPFLLSELRQMLPRTKITATAHTVLRGDFRYPLKGHGFKAPIRWLANQTWVPYSTGLWGAQTWSQLDGIVVHSKLQEEEIYRAGCMNVAVIPHFVSQEKVKAARPAGIPATLVIFGYISPDKGQDVVIQALPHLLTKHPEVQLKIAGGLRRDQDRAYERLCRKLITRLKLERHVEITGYVPSANLDSVYDSVSLVIAPFRETSGSGSITQALARGAPVLASDLPLNQELNEREPGSVHLFRAGDSADCAKQIGKLLDSVELFQNLQQAGLRYAKKMNSENISKLYVDFLLSLK